MNYMAKLLNQSQSYDEQSWDPENETPEAKAERIAHRNYDRREALIDILAPQF